MRFVSILPFVYLFHHLLESVWTHRYLFYTLGYNQYFFVTQIVPALTTWKFSRIGSCVPVTYPPTNMWLLWFAYFLIFVLFSEHVLFLALQDDLGSSYIFCHKHKSLCLPYSTPLATKTTDSYWSFSHHSVSPFSRMSYWCTANVVFSLLTSFT